MCGASSQVTYINAHVYSHHCNQVTHLTALDRRLMNASTPTRRRSFSLDGGDSGVTFWQLAHVDAQGQRQSAGVTHKGASSTSMLPVGIRTLPDVTSSRTGEGVFPGEHVEVVATREDAALTYLQLADHRGWVFSLNPTTATLLFVPAVGYTYLPQKLKFQVSSTEVLYACSPGLVKLMPCICLCHWPVFFA